MKTTTLLVAASCVAALVFGAPHSAYADEIAEANQLAVSAVKEWSQATSVASTTMEEVSHRLALLEGVQSKLEKVIDVHSGTDLALKLVIGESIGPISVPTVAIAVENARQDVLQKFNNCNDHRDCAITIALVSARSLQDDKLRARSLGTLALATLDASILSEALASVDYNIPGLHGGAVQQFAIKQAEAGRYSAAIETVSKLNDPDLRRDAFRSISAAMISLGNLPKALESARQIDDGMFDRDFALSDVAAAQTAAGQHADASITLSEIKDTRDKALVDMAVANAKNGFVDRISETLDAIKREHYLVDGAAQVAAILEDLDFLKKVEDFAHSIDYSHSRDRALKNVATAYAELSLYDSAYKALEGIQNSAWIDNGLIVIAGAQSRSKLFKEAFSTVELIETDSRRDDAYIEIANAMASFQMFDDAIRSIDSMGRDYKKARALKVVVKQQANAHLFSDAVHTAESIVLKNSRAWALREVALAQALSGEMQEALNIAFSMSGLENRVIIWTGLIEATDG